MHEPWSSSKAMTVIALCAQAGYSWPFLTCRMHLLPSGPPTCTSKLERDRKARNANEVRGGRTHLSGRNKWQLG
eukprot:593414-Pelagomonas_calceolata.AAC.1